MAGVEWQSVSIETWLAFTAASAVLLVIPGPTILLVISYALGRGMRTALPVAVGVALGDFTAMTLSMLGVGALLAASAILFTALKWAGAAYLIWLGIQLWRAGGTLDATPRGDAAPPARMLGHAWLVTALNPKSITFCRLPAAVHRPQRRLLVADVDLRDDLHLSGVRQRSGLCADRLAGADAGAE